MTTELQPRTIVKCRKNYQCWECCRPIRKGQQCQYGVWADEDGIRSQRLCLRCAKWEALYFKYCCNEEYYMGWLMDLRRDVLNSYLDERKRRTKLGHENDSSG